MLAALFPQKDPPKVVFVTGDDEYRSEYTMPALAGILEKHHGLRTQVLFARPTPQSNKNIEGLEALRTADLAVFFLRWRELPEEQYQAIRAYEKSGRPIAGFRTSTHSLKYPAGHMHEAENDAFSLRVFGARWTRHHGHLSTTRTEKAGEHAILNGVNPSPTTGEWGGLPAAFESARAARWYPSRDGPTDRRAASHRARFRVVLPAASDSRALR